MTQAEKPTATDTIDIGDREVLRFWPTHKKIKDKVPRCISCGQIDEQPWHIQEYCPGMGGSLPFPTSTIKINLKADSGFRSEITARLTIEQWTLINLIIADQEFITAPILDQNGKHVGTAQKSIADMFKVEAFVDDEGTNWTPPTSWAYYAACKALNAHKATLDAK